MLVLPVALLLWDAARVVVGFAVVAHLALVRQADGNRAGAFACTLSTLLSPCSLHGATSPCGFRAKRWGGFRSLRKTAHAAMRLFLLLAHQLEPQYLPSCFP